MTYLLLMSAGLGTRLNQKLPKALVLINEKPVFIHSLEKFINNKQIDKFIVVYHPNYEKLFQEELKKYQLDDKVVLIEGDTLSRQDSIKKAIKQLAELKDDDLIITHDSARINVNCEIINDSILNTKKTGYSTAAYPISDSLICTKGYVKYLDRTGKFLVQTPQSFLFKYWKDKPTENSTDLFTYLGLRLKERNLSKGCLNNYKITYPEDLKICCK